MLLLYQKTLRKRLCVYEIQYKTEYMYLTTHMIRPYIKEH